MAVTVTSQVPFQENTADRFPLLMERVENHEGGEHVIDIERVGDASSSGSSNNDSPHGLSVQTHENRPSDSGQLLVTQSPSPSPNGSINRGSPLPARGEGVGRRWSPFNTVLWISLEVVFTIGQVIAAIIVLYISRDEKPKAPLFAWVVGHATGSVLSLPIYYWRYLNRNGDVDRRSSQSGQDLPPGNSTLQPTSSITISLTRSLDPEGANSGSTHGLDDQNIRVPHAWAASVMDHYKMVLECFFAVWFVVGNVWVFGGHSSSAADAPNLYRLCIVYLTFSCVGYALPFILCAMICCCLPCVLSAIGVSEENGMRGASEESINALPLHKFKLRRNESSINKDSCTRTDEGGTVAVGTEKEHAIFGEDAMCCICLTKYTDGDDLRELPCSHFFHRECVDKWLKINASCPLCKFRIAGAGDKSQPVSDASQQV